MNFIGRLFHTMERSSAGSRGTSETVLSMCGDIIPHSALFAGDDLYTPKLIKKRFGCDLLSVFTDEERTKQALEMGLEACTVRLFELPECGAGYDFLWYNGFVEYDGIETRIDRIKSAVKSGGTTVYRTLCWLIDPSPDTYSYCTRRFGVIEPFDKVLGIAKEQGFKIKDFYIAPKTDWTKNFYDPLSVAAAEYEHTHPESADVLSAMNELRREIDMFELHCEEYSYVYYILQRK